jgi:hypothetical protein
MTTDRILRGDPLKAPRLAPVHAVHVIEQYLAAMNRILAAALELREEAPRIGAPPTALSDALHEPTGEEKS